MAEFRTKDGKTVEVSDFQLAQNPKLAEGLTPVTTSGVSQGILTGVETGAATVANLGSAVSQFAGEVDAMGNPIDTVAPVAPESLVPGAFTPAALERRQANPGAALAGSIAVEAPTLLIPGGAEGWVGRLGLGLARGAASGAIAEAGSNAITGEQFSAKHAAFYGLVGESLGALANAGLGRLMRMTGKEAPSALEVAARRASKADVADALGETEGSALKATKMADNAPELTEQAATELHEHIEKIGARLEKAEASAFSDASVRRNVSSNATAQADNLLTRGVELEQAAKQLAQDVAERAPAAEAPLLERSKIGTALDYRPPTAAETQKEAANRVLAEIRRDLGAETIDAVNESAVNIPGRKGLTSRSSVNQVKRIEAMEPEARMAHQGNMEDLAAQARKTPFSTKRPSDYHQNFGSGDGFAKFAKRAQTAVDELLAKRSSADMYLALRKVSTELAQDAPEGLPDYVTAALGRLDESLVDEATWGNVAKLAGKSKAGQAARGAFATDATPETVAGLFADGADRTSFNAFLESAEAAAKGSSDKALAKSVAAAREAVAKGDDATIAGLLAGNFAERATKSLTRKVVGGALRYGLGAIGLHGGIAGGVAGHAIGEALEPAVARFVDGAAPVLRRLAASSANSIQTAGRAMSNSALRASQSTIGKLGAPTMSAGVASFMSGHDNLRSAFAEKREVLDLVQRDPMALVGELDDSLGGLSASHPELHAEIAAKHYQALSYVRTKIPETIGVSLSSPSGIPPSSLAIRTFSLYYSGATDPSSVIEDVRNNRVRQEQLEALRTVWPEVYQDLKTATLQGMAESKPTVQQRMRMDLLFDFGPALDAGLSWSLALVMDGQRAQAAQSQGKPGSMPRGRSTPSTQAQQPQGLAALANPQV